MRCNVLRWLWGVLPLALLGWVTLQLERPNIEADLTQRAQKALAAAGATWATPTFEGRDAVLTGEAVDESEQKAGIGAVATLYGLRQLDDRSTLVDAVPEYTWSALTENGRLRLQGFVPNDATRRDIVGIAKATFPTRTLDDRLKLGRGAPDATPWLGGISFGLKQLARLKAGRIALDGTALTVEGEAEDTVAYKAVKQALGQGLPQGVTLKADRVTPPVVKPYVWGVTRHGTAVEFTGFAPSEADQEFALSQARRVLPGLSINDRMGVAASASREWRQAVTAAIARLGQLDDATVELKDQVLSVAGEADAEATADAVRQALKAEVPGAIRVSDAIKFRAPVVRAPSPYVTSAELQSSAVVLDGFAPSEEAHQALIAKVRQRFASARLDDRVKVAPGAVPGWLPCMDVGLAGLTKLIPGARVSLTDARLTVAGEGATEQSVSDVPGLVRAAAQSAGCESEVKVALSAAAVEEARRKAAEEEARRRAPEPPKAQPAPAPAALSPELARCQQALSSTAKEGVILFEYSSSELKEDSTPTLKKLAEVAEACPKARIEIEGHTDDDGASELNQKLSEKRARVVAEVLASEGVDLARLSTRGYGETKPVVPNDTAANKAKNRRIEFTVKAD